MIIILSDCGSLPIPLVVQRIRRICVAGVLGLEPRLTEPESVGLPITLYPICLGSGWSHPPWRKDKLYCKPSFGPKPLLRRVQPVDGAAQLSWTWVRSFIRRDSPYASTAKRAKPPTLNAASTQPIPSIALSAATEVVSPATR